jgi:hypothetical protein
MLQLQVTITSWSYNLELQVRVTSYNYKLKFQVRITNLNNKLELKLQLQVKVIITSECYNYKFYKLQLQ